MSHAKAQRSRSLMFFCTYVYNKLQAVFAKLCAFAWALLSVHKICASLRGLREIFLHTKSTELTEISLFFCVKIMFSYNTLDHSRDAIIWRLYVRVVLPHGFVQFVCDKQGNTPQGFVQFVRFVFSITDSKSGSREALCSFVLLSKINCRQTSQVILDRRTYFSHADAAEYAERRGASPRTMRSKSAPVCVVCVRYFCTQNPQNSQKYPCSTAWDSCSLIIFSIIHETP